MEARRESNMAVKIESKACLSFIWKYIIVKLNLSTLNRPWSFVASNTSYFKSSALGCRLPASTLAVSMTRFGLLVRSCHIDPGNGGETSSNFSPQIVTCLTILSTSFHFNACGPWDLDLLTCHSATPICTWVQANGNFPNWNPGQHCLTCSYSMYFSQWPICAKISKLRSLWRPAKTSLTPSYDEMILEYENGTFAVNLTLSRFCKYHQRFPCFQLQYIRT